MPTGRATNDTAGTVPSTRLRLLGAFGLEIDGAAVTLPIGSQRVVAYVALRQWPVDRAIVAAALWPDSAPARAAACLRSALWRLRSSGADILRTLDDRLVLCSELAVDVQELEARAARLRDGSVEPGEAELSLDGLRGELLAGWTVDDWTMLERERVRQVRLHGLEALAVRLIALGRHAEALDVAMEAVRDEPLRESAHRVVVQVHLGEGNVSEAVRHHAWYAELLLDELGVAPSPLFAGLLPAGSVTAR